MKNYSRKNTLRIITIAVIVLFSVVSVYYLKHKTSVKASSQILSESQKALPTFTADQLKKYDGTNLNLPIYLVLDGNVYDVSKGSEFYKAGGPYHYLAGKDSSFELHMVGGDIIKRKYPIVGRLISTN